MKTTYELHQHVERALNASGFNASQVLNAIQSALNDGTAAVAGDGKTTLGNGKLIKDDKGNKDANFRIAEKQPDVIYIGKTTAPLRFVSWHDAQRAVWKKYGDPSGEITLDILPADLTVWIAKFAVKPDAPVPVKSSKGNGQRNKGNVESVPVAAVPGK